MTRPPAFFHPVATEGRALDAARCTTCDTAYEFSIHHLTGATIERCRCAGWRPIVRRAPFEQPPDKRTTYRKCKRSHVAERREALLRVIPADPMACVTASAIAEKAHMPIGMVRDDLAALVAKRMVKQDVNRRNRASLVFWRAA